MSSLSALPDYEVARMLLPDARATHLNRPEALWTISRNPGVIPIAVDPVGNGTVFWADIGAHPLKEWQFIYSIQYLSETDAIRSSFTTDFDILADDRVVVDGIYPHAFIFHVSRCGSTLLAKALSRRERNVVINQGGVLQRGLWARLTRDFRDPLLPTPANLDAFRRIVLAMTRPRHEGVDTAIVKFVSWNTLLVDFIHQAFPEVPMLFLYRDPVEVIASVIQRPTPALVAKGSRQGALLIDRAASEERLSDMEYLALCNANYLRAALARVAPGGMRVLNYAELTRENFGAILREGLLLRPDQNDEAVMLEQFKFHSKDDGDSAVFQPDGVEKSRMISPNDREMIRRACGHLVDELDRSEGNLFRRN